MKKNINKSLKHYKTFDEWSALGFKIKKHTKSHKRNKKGIALFHKNQVEKYNPKNYSKKNLYPTPHEDYDDDYADDYNKFYGDPWSLA